MRKRRAVMAATRWLLILIFILRFEEKKASCRHESTKQQQDLFWCGSSHFGPNSSIVGDWEVTLGFKNKRWSQNQTILCSMSSSSDRMYLEIKLKRFYDVCAMSVWTNASNLTVANFRIQYSKYGKLWFYYKEMDQVKDFQGVKDNSGLSLHNIQLTTNGIRFLPVNWEKRTCLQFAIHGNVAWCSDSQRRMDLWCNKTLSYRNPPSSGCSGELRARYDRNERLPWKLWRCYHESALTPDLSGYDDKLKSSCYFSRHLELKQVLKSCSKNYTTEKCPLIKESRNKTSVNSNFSEAPTTLSTVTKKITELLSNGKTNVDVNISEALTNLSRVKEKTNEPLSNKGNMNMSLSEALANLNRVKEKTTQPLLSCDILQIIDVLENISPERVLENASEHHRDQFAKHFLEVSSALLNESNVRTWTSAFSNSSTLSRLLKAVEDFGEAFTKYLECDNKDENVKTFSFFNVKFIATSCVNRSAFPLKLFSSQGCPSLDDSPVPDNCKAWSGGVDSATLSGSLLDEHQQYRVSFISYKNAHRLFPLESTRGTTILRSAKVDSRILSLTINPDGLIVKGNPVNVTLRPFSVNALNEENFHCGFWNFSASGTVNGAWSTDGCTVLSINTSQVTCQCDHLTNFALLLRIDPDSASQGLHQEILMWMTYLGCSLSLAAEILCVIAFILFTKRLKTTIKIHFNLVACLAFGHFVFLAGIERATVSLLLCRFVAASLHYFFLASFMWMLVEGIHLLSRVKTSLQQQQQLYELPYLAYCLAYGLPLAIVGATFAVKFNDYGTSQHCWLSVESGTKWSFIGPVCSVILVNFFVLGLVLERLTSTEMFRRRNEWQKMRLTARASVMILPLLGLSWFFGLIAVNQGTIVFQYLFVGFNSLQGGFIFLFHCAFNSEVQAGIRNMMRKRRVVQEVTRAASKRSPMQEKSPPQGHSQKQSSNNTPRFSAPFIVIDQRFELAQSVRLTKLIRKASEFPDIDGARNKETSPNSATVKHAWGNQMS